MVFAAYIVTYGKDDPIVIHTVASYMVIIAISLTTYIRTLHMIMLDHSCI